MTALFAIDLSEDAVDQSPISHETIVRTRAGHERQSRHLVLERERRLSGSGLAPCLVGRNDPCRVRVLLARALHEPDDRLDPAVGVGPGGTHTETLVAPSHQVRHVHLGGQPQLVASEVDVLGCRDKMSAVPRDDPYSLRLL